MTLSQVQIKEIKKEERSFIRANAQKSLRRDANLVKPKKTKIRLPDTPEVIAERLRIKKWSENNKDKVAQNQKTQYEKRVSASKLRIAQAIAQDIATQRNLENILDPDDGVIHQ